MGNYINYCVYKRVSGGTKRFSDTRFNMPPESCAVPILPIPWFIYLYKPKCLVVELKITAAVRRRWYVSAARFSAAAIFNPKPKAIFPDTVFRS